jgi:hypothetical protein
MNIKTIFDHLIEKKIPFSVGVNDSTMKLATIEEVKKEWFILILKKDKDLAPVYFHQSNLHLCVEHEMDQNEIDQFLKIRNQFTKFIHSDAGRIYEFKTNSLKEKYDEIIHESLS